MQYLSRTIISGSGGLFISTGLALAMIAMIKVEFEAQNTQDIVMAGIDPSNTIVEPPIQPIKPPKLKKVEVPPAAPVIETRSVEGPSEPISKDVETIPPFEFMKPEIDAPVITVADQEPDCHICIAPIMPVRATKSGYCKIRLDVDADGSTFNINAEYCTERLFARNAVKAVSGFKYRPKIVNGQRIAMSGILATIAYRLTDENGDVIPE